MKHNCFLCVLYFPFILSSVTSIEEFFLDDELESKTYQTQLYRVSVNITNQNDCNFNMRDDGIPLEIMTLSVDILLGTARHGYLGWFLQLKLFLSPTFNFTEICIRSTQYTFVNTVVNNSVSLKVEKLISNKIENSSYELIIFKLWRLKKIILDIEANEKGKFSQRIKFLSPLPEFYRENGSLDRFAYVDETIKIIHVAGTSSNHSTIDSIWCENNNGSFDLIEDVTSLKETNQKISSATNFCKISSKPRTSTMRTIIISVSVGIFVIIFTLTVLWYCSTPKQKTVYVIYCLCEKHEITAKVLKQFLRFMEANCFVRIIEPTYTINYNESETGDEELLQSHLNQSEIVIFVPFPKINNHQGSNNVEMHLLCDKSKTLKKKAELLLPFQDMEYTGLIGSDWPRKTYKVFYLLQDMPRFIKFIHPCYYPRCFERIFRRKLSEPYLLKLLRDHTFTNDYIRDLTDPKLMAVSKETNDSVLPILNLDSILSEYD